MVLKASELRDDLTKEMERANVLEQDNNFLNADIEIGEITKKKVVKSTTYWQSGQILSF